MSEQQTATERKTCRCSRRSVLRSAGSGILATGGSGWFEALAGQLAVEPARRRQAILLWMSGGPSQTDTFDMKPDHENGGPIKEVATSVAGLRFSEHLPVLAKHAAELAVIRSLSTKEGDHDRGTHVVRTGQRPGTPERFPSIACALAKELLFEELRLPGYVSIAPTAAANPAAFGAGFLGPKYSPAIVGTNAETQSDVGSEFARLRLENLELPAGVEGPQAARRRALWNALQGEFLKHRTHPSFNAHQTLYQQAFDMMSGPVKAAFDLDSEPAKVREAYGRGRFGQGCLLARRLVERGVPFVEVALGDGLGWDTHQDNFRRVEQLCGELDAGWGTLISELKARGLLETTTILWMGEFGRTPVINANGGRDHFPAAWTTVFAGGGIRGGQAYGRTSADGMRVEENRVEIGDILATLCHAVGVDWQHENFTDSGRPIPLAEGSPIRDVLI